MKAIKKIGIFLLLFFVFLFSRTQEIQASSDWNFQNLDFETQIQENSQFPKTDYETDAKVSKVAARTVDKSNYRAQSQSENQSTLLGVIIHGALIIGIVLLIGNMIKKIRRMKKEKVIKPTEQIMYFREIPRKNATPTEAIYEVKKKHTNLLSKEIGKAFVATLLNFNLKKIISFESVEEKEVTKIKILDPIAINSLENEDEKLIGEFLIGAMQSKKEITVEELQNYIKSSPKQVVKLQKDMTKGVEKQLADKKIVNQENLKEYKRTYNFVQVYILAVIWLIIAGILLAALGGSFFIGFAVFCITLAIHFGVTRKYLNNLPVYTQEGINDTEKWRGLKKYMEEFSMLDKKEVPEIVVWEEFLVYATAFGIADKELDQLGELYPEIQNTLDFTNASYSYVISHAHFSKNFIHAISNSIESTTSSKGKK